MEQVSNNKFFEYLKKGNQDGFWLETVNYKTSELFDFLDKHESLFIEFIAICIADFVREKELINHYPFFAYCIYGDANWAKYRSKLQRYLHRYPFIEEMIIDSNKTLINSLEDEIEWNKDEWVLIDKQLESVKKHRINYKGLSYSIKSQLKTYTEHLLENGETKEKIKSKIDSIKKIVDAYLETNDVTLDDFSLIKKITVDQLVLHFQINKKEFKMGTIRKFFTDTKMFYEWLIETEQLTRNNPFKEYKFVNSDSYTESTKYISEQIVDEINKVSNNFEDIAKTTWIVLMNTGMRVSEMLNIEADNIWYDSEKNMNFLKYRPDKTMKNRLRKGIDSYHTIPIIKEVADMLNKQLKTSSVLRNNANVNKIFIEKRKGFIKPIQAKSIADKINKEMKKYNILNEDGSPFQYKHHMCRKTFVIELIEKGRSVEEIADYINHLSKETTEKYYADIRLSKIASLDSQMFEKLFEETLDKEIKTMYSKKEKNSFFEEIKLGVRDTPEGHGHCAKHVSFGPCVKKSCVGCNFLIIGPQKLPNWYKLYQEQQVYLKELENEFKNNGDQNYENNRLYQREVNLLTIYKDTIDKTEKFAERMGINVSQYQI